MVYRCHLSIIHVCELCTEFVLYNKIGIYSKHKPDSVISTLQNNARNNIQKICYDDVILQRTSIDMNQVTSF